MDITRASIVTTKPIWLFLMATVGVAVLMLALAWSQHGATPAYAAPPNDDFASAEVIPGAPFTTTQSTVGATVEPGEPAPCAGMGSTVWFSITPSVNSVMVVDTVGSNYDTALAAYTGGDVGTLANVACNDDFHGFQSEIGFPATAGVTYSIQAGGFAGSTGDLTLNVRAFPPPTNDDFANAVVIAGAPFTANQSTIGATVEPGEPAPCAGMGSTVWFSFTPAVNSEVTVDTVGSNYDTALAAYTGGDVGTLANVACNDDFHGFQSEIGFLATAGVTYSIQAGGFAGSTGDLTLNVTAIELPPTSIEVSKTAEVDGRVVSGTITITNVGENPALISAMADSLEVHFPRKFTPPPLPEGSTANWFKVADVPVGSPGLIPVGETAFIDYSFDLCSAADYAGANSMRNVVAVTLWNKPENARTDTVVTRSDSFPPPQCVRWSEVDDAGDLPGTAQVPGGVGALGVIGGTITSDADADMYQVCLTGGGTFSATTNPPGARTFDTQLFLFDAAGNGIYANDDSGGLGSLLPAGDPLTPVLPGVYYLAISAFNRDPVSPAGSIFLGNSLGPIGPGGGLPISGWSGTGFLTGSYSIALTGAEICETP